MLVFSGTLLSPTAGGKRLALAQPPLRKTNGKRSHTWHLITHVKGGYMKADKHSYQPHSNWIQILAFDTSCSGGRYTPPRRWHKSQKKKWSGILIQLLVNLSKINTLICLLESSTIHHTFRWQDSFPLSRRQGGLTLCLGEEIIPKLFFLSSKVMVRECYFIIQNIYGHI